jgi:hypothetical protein
LKQTQQAPLFTFLLELLLCRHHNPHDEVSQKTETTQQNTKQPNNANDASIQTKVISQASTYTRNLLVRELTSYLPFSFKF